MSDEKKQPKDTGTLRFRLKANGPVDINVVVKRLGISKKDVRIANSKVGDPRPVLYIFGVDPSDVLLVIEVCGPPAEDPEFRE